MGLDLVLDLGHMIIKALPRARSRRGGTADGLVMGFQRTAMLDIPRVVESPEAAKGSGVVMTSVATFCVLIKAAVISNVQAEKTD